MADAFLRLFETLGWMMTGAALWQTLVVGPRYARSKRQASVLLSECLEFIKRRGTYFYTNERRGPAASLVRRIEEALGGR